MTAEAEVAERGQAVDATALECVELLVAAADRRDLEGCRGLLDADVRMRIDGSLVAVGIDGVTALVECEWRSHPEAAVRVIDVNVADSTVYVRHVIQAERPLLGYSLFEVRGGRVREASHFFAAVPAPETPSETAPVQEDAVLDVRGPEPVVDVRAPAPTVLARGRWVRRVGMPAAAIASALVEDTLLATPVIATAARYGSVRVFLVFAPLYTLLSLAVALVTIHVLCAPRDAHHGRLARWLAKSSHSRRTKRWLRAGSTFGFVLSASVLGSPATVWALHTLGARRNLRRNAVIASSLWSVTFVLTYLLAAEVVFL